jgi:HEAT repeat protein
MENLMKRKLIFSAVASAIVLLALAIVSYHLGKESVSSTPDAVRAAVDERLAALRGIEERLARLEGEVASLRGPSSTKDADGGGEPGPDADGRRAAIDSALSALQLRVTGLEEDPVRRGYSFLASENAEMRREGINILDRVARFDPEARAAIRSLLQDPSARVREQAAQKLRDLKDKESAQAMATLLADPDARTRRRAVEALGAMGASQSAREIGRNLVSDADEQVRQVAADVLGRLGSPEAAEFLTNALKDPSEAVRGEAIASLGEIGATSAAPQLRAMYEQDPGRERLRLAMALKSLGDEVPVQREVVRLSDLARSSPDDGVREQAIRELATVARDSAKPVFTQALEDPSPRVRREAERALR